MKIGDRVQTPDGAGVIVLQEGAEGILAHRFGVKLDIFPFKFTNFVGPVFYMESELMRMEE